MRAANIKQAGADRFWAIAQRHTPKDITVTYHNRLAGKAWPKARRIATPRPTTRYRLKIYLHEVAHVVLGHAGTKPRAVEEAEATEWALDVMRREGA